MQELLINLLNTDAVVTVIVGVIVAVMVRWFASSQGASFKKYEGLLVTAIKAAERIVPDDTPNKGMARADAAMKLFVTEYERITGVTAEKSIIEAASLALPRIHAQLETGGNLVSSAAKISAMLFAVLSLNSGCAMLYTSTPILSESNGETVVANAYTLKTGFGTKDATAISDYSLSADAGLKIGSLNNQTDSSTALVQGMRLGADIARGQLGLPAATSAVEETQVEEPAPKTAMVVKKQPTKATTKKTATAKPKVTVTPPSPALTAAKAEAVSSGKPLVVVASSPSCGFCEKLDIMLNENPAFTGRADIILYRETADWASNGALKWTGGGQAPIVRVTQWDATGKTICDKKLNRPATVAAIEAALSACSPPSPQ